MINKIYMLPKNVKKVFNSEDFPKKNFFDPTNFNMMFYTYLNLSMF